MVKLALVELPLSPPDIDNSLEIDGVDAVGQVAAHHCLDESDQFLIVVEGTSKGVERLGCKLPLAGHVKDQTILLQILHECEGLHLAAGRFEDVMSIGDNVFDRARLGVVDIALEEWLEHVRGIVAVAGVEDETVLRERDQAALVVDLARYEKELKGEFRGRVRVRGTKASIVVRGAFGRVVANPLEGVVHHDAAGDVVVIMCMLADSGSEDELFGRGDVDGVATKSVPEDSRADLSR